MAKVTIVSLVCYGNHDIYFVQFSFADSFDRNRLNRMVKFNYFTCLLLCENMVENYISLI